MRSLFTFHRRRPDRAMHGYVYYRWTSRYMAVVRFFLDRPWFGPLRSASARELERTHHAKVVSTEDARRVITVDRPVEWRDLERVVPYPVARDIVLDPEGPIAVAQCACRSVAASHGEHDGSCGPLESCLYVGDPMASFVVEKQADTARFVTREEALALIETAAERGNVHTLWFKDAAGGRMYAICNCCSCCCIGLKAEREGFRPLAGSGYVAIVDEGACTGCGACIEACPFGAIEAVAPGRDAVHVASERCFGCGACERVCPVDAIELQRATEGAEPLPWERLA